MNILKYFFITLVMTSSLSIIAMDNNPNAECCVCYRSKTELAALPVAFYRLSRFFTCVDEHPDGLCHTCLQAMIATGRTLACPLCRAERNDNREIVGARAPMFAPRPAAPQYMPQQPHVAPQAHQFQHNNNHGGGGGGNKGGKAILLIAAMGTIYFTAKYIYHKFKTQEKPANDTDNFSDFGFDDETWPTAISASDIDAFASSNSQSDVSIDEDWFN